MTAQTIQQTVSKARNVTMARVAAIGLALVLFVAGALAYLNATSISTVARVHSSPAATVRRSHVSPAQWSTGSAYDGGSYVSARSAASIDTSNPIRHASSSAYDGGSYVSVPQVAPPQVRDVPALHSTGSAYDGQ